MKRKYTKPISSIDLSELFKELSEFINNHTEKLDFYKMLKEGYDEMSRTQKRKEVKMKLNDLLIALLDIKCLGVDLTDSFELLLHKIDSPESFQP